MLAALSMIILTSCRAPEGPTAPTPLPTRALQVETHQSASEPLVYEEAPSTEGPPETEAAELAPVTEPTATAASTDYGSPLVVQESGRYLTWEELDSAGAAAGWEAEPWLKMRNIVSCETGGTLYTAAHNQSDANGGSYGLAQINGRYAFDQAGLDFEQRYDPVVNLRAALWLWEARGRVFGGAGGWYWCALGFGYD